MGYKESGATVDLGPDGFQMNHEFAVCKSHKLVSDVWMKKYVNPIGSNKVQEVGFSISFVASWTHKNGRIDEVVYFDTLGKYDKSVPDTNGQICEFYVEYRDNNDHNDKQGEELKAEKKAYESIVLNVVNGIRCIRGLPILTTGNRLPMMLAKSREIT